MVLFKGKKYRLLEDMTCTYEGRTLYRIQALKDFKDVKKGNLGGWVESEYNLSQDGNCWLYDESIACDYARIMENATIRHSSKISGNALIRDRAVITRSIVKDKTYIGNFAVVFNSIVEENAQIFDNAYVNEGSIISGYTKIREDAHICRYVKMSDHTEISGRAIVNENSKISGCVNIYGNAMVCENSNISGYIDIYGKMSIPSYSKISEQNHILSIGPIGSRDDTTTFCLGDNGKIRVKCGCFDGAIDTFEKEVNEEHLGNKHWKVYKKAIEMAKIQIMESDREE